MEWILLILGFTSCVIFCSLRKRRDEVHGSIDIDPITGLCRFRITSDKLANPRKKYAIFKISHDAEISRDER